MKQPMPEDENTSTSSSDDEDNLPLAVVFKRLANDKLPGQASKLVTATTVIKQKGSLMFLH